MPRKPAAEKTVAMIFTIPQKIKSALYKKVKDGNRSRFVTEVLATRLGVALAPVKKAAVKKKVAPKKAAATKTKSLFRLFR